MTSDKEKERDEFSRKAAQMFAQLDEEYEHGTITGRLSRMPEMLPLPVITDSVLKVQEHIHNEMVAILGIDYGKLERSVVNYGLDIFEINERKASLIVIDEFFDMPEPDQILDKEPKKQNGRSAAYLAHDRTKQHKRRKQR